MTVNIQFPSWWSASADSDPRQFQTPADVPPGWTHRVGAYDPEIGQFQTVEEAEARAAAKRKARDAAAPNDITAERDPVTGRALDAGASAVVRADRVEGRVRTAPLDGGPVVQPVSGFRQVTPDQPPERDPITGQALDAGASAVARADRVEGRVRTESLSDATVPQFAPASQVASQAGNFPPPVTPFDPLDRDRDGARGGDVPDSPPALTGKNKAGLQAIARKEGVSFAEDASNRELRDAIEAKRAG